MSLSAASLIEASAALDLPQAIRFIAETGSTNADLRRLAEQGAPHGSALVAGSQTQGRGRLGRTWLTPKGSLALSVLLRPNLPLAGAARMNLAAAVATSLTCGDAFRIKWPNDVLAPDGRKVAGILAEVEARGGRVDFLVVGIGVNLSGAPAEVAQATSLQAVDGQIRDPNAFAATLVQRLLHQAHRLEADPEAVLQIWRDRSATLGQWVRVGALQGRAVALDADGALRVEDFEGGIHRVLSGDVEPVAMRNGRIE